MGCRARLDPRGFAALPPHRQERVRTHLKVHKIDYRDVFLIERHPHTWVVYRYHRHNGAVQINRQTGVAVGDQVTIRGTRW